MVSDTASAVTADVLAEVAAVFGFGNAGTVTNFILDHPALSPLLLQARKTIERYFGKSTPVVLDVLRDPDEDNSGVLVAFVQTPLDADDALDRLDRFHDAWWRVASGSAAVPLQFTLEYV
jgi:hypothetical protein